MKLIYLAPVAFLAATSMAQAEKSKSGKVSVSQLTPDQLAHYTGLTKKEKSKYLKKMYSKKQKGANKYSVQQETADYSQMSPEEFMKMAMEKFAGMDKMSMEFGSMMRKINDRVAKLEDGLANIMAHMNNMGGDYGSNMGMSDSYSGGLLATIKEINRMAAKAAEDARNLARDEAAYADYLAKKAAEEARKQGKDEAEYANDKAKDESDYANDKAKDGSEYANDKADYAEDYAKKQAYDVIKRETEMIMAGVDPEMYDMVIENMILQAVEQIAQMMSVDPENIQAGFYADCIAAHYETQQAHAAFDHGDMTEKEIQQHVEDDYKSKYPECYDAMVGIYEGVQAEILSLAEDSYESVMLALDNEAEAARMQACMEAHEVIKGDYEDDKEAGYAVWEQEQPACAKEFEDYWWDAFLKFRTNLALQLSDMNGENDKDGDNYKNDENHKDMNDDDEKDEGDSKAGYGY